MVREFWGRCDTKKGILDVFIRQMLTSNSFFSMFRNLTKESRKNSGSGKMMNKSISRCKLVHYSYGMLLFAKSE